MKNVFLFFVLTALVIGANAQEKKAAAKKEQFVEKREKTQYAALPEKSINLEIVGRGLLWSVNFDAMVTDNIAVGAGFGTVSISASAGTTSASASVTAIPVYGNYYFSESNHRIYATGGVDVMIVSGSISSASYGFSTGATGTIIAPVIGAGYEYRGDDWFLFRAAPYLIMVSGGTYFTGGLTVGYAF
ncbi:MAG: hypothetical protein IPM57_05800 [Oligoflexia bacterium]|nr:hypothetical protein [Oligoflexia bacterium]